LAGFSRAAALLYAAALFLLARGYVIDDTYIHLQFARNLAEGRGPVFHPGGPPVYACSSPLWVGALTVLHAAGAGGPAGARLLSSLCAGACVLLAAALARRLGLPRVMQLLLPLLVALDPWMTRWGASGMETSAAAAAVLLWALLTAGPASAGRLAGAGLAAGAAFLVRPELGFLGLLTPLAPGCPRGRIASVACWLAPVAAWTAVALSVFGTPLPVTAAAKARHMGIGEYVMTEGRRAAGAVALSLGPLIPAAAMLMLRRRPTGQTLLLLAVPSALIVLLAAGGAPMISRYLMPALPPVLVATAVMASGSRGRTVALWGALAAAWQAGVGALYVWPHMARMSRNILVYETVAGGLDSLTPPGSLIAVQEIGVFGYRSHRMLFDLGGLVSGDSIAAAWPGLREDPVGAVSLLLRHGVTHYLDPHGAAAGLAGAEDRLGVEFVPLGRWEFPGGTSLSSRETYERVLYRLDRVPAQSPGSSPTGAR
jgi:hypothetical protein